jgi:addiction module RelE/StbE family toxin
MWRIEWSPAATEDLESIRRYLVDHHPELAQIAVRRIQESVQTLTKFPRSGRVGEIEGTRELYTTPTPHVVVYSVGEDVVNVLRVLRNPSNKLAESST